MFHGSMVAIVTPMTMDGQIDETSLRNLIDFHIASGTDAIVVIGTTGESVTLTEEEQVRVIKIALSQVAGKIPVIVGSGSNATAKTIHHTIAAMELGVDACLVVTPYYNKPTQEGLYQHFKAVASAAAIPIILYNVPGRTGVDMSAETVGRLASISNIVGIKEASGKVERTTEIIKHCGSRLDVYSGEDHLTYELMTKGAKGVISVTANIAPKLMREMCAATLSGDFAHAEEINRRLAPLHKALFVESNPIPIKWALAKMGLIPPGIRLPLTPLASEWHEQVLSAMEQAGIHGIK